MSTIFWVGLGDRSGVTCLEHEQSWVQRPNCRGAGQDVPANKTLLDLECLVPSGWDHNLQIQAGPPTAKQSLVHPKDGGPSGLQEGLLVSHLLARGSHLQPPSLEFPHRKTTAPSARRFSRDWGLSGRWRVRGNMARDTSTGVFVLTQPTLIYTRGTGLFHRAPIARVTRVGHQEMLPPCGRFP